MRFTNAILECIEFDTEDSFDFDFVDDDIVDWMNNKRASKGYTDLVKVDLENDVYYNSYLIVKNQQIKIRSVVNCSEHDDYEVYTVDDLTDEEKQMLLWKVIEYFAHEEWNR